jgi:hypothetical protein
MDLPLNQLVYTSFSYVGFGLLTSEQVPLHIEQTFLKQVVYRYWNAFEHENHSYRAAYLLQITPEDWLFGWLYNDERDDIDRSHIPHFICYHVREPLYAFCIEKICACLQKGPVELVDHHSFSNSLKPLILKDVSSYQEARSGVVISWEARQQIHMNLKQGKLTDLFIPVKEDERLIERSLPVEPQQVVAKDKSPDNGSLLPLIPLKEHQRLIERSLPVEPQQVVAKDKSADNGSLVLDRNFILLLGISFGIITSLVVIALIYVFVMTWVRNQPTQSPSQNALPRTGSPTTKISPKP